MKMSKKIHLLALSDSNFKRNFRGISIHICSYMRTFGEGNDSWACNDEILSLSFDLISMKKIRLLLPLSKKKRQWRKVSFGSIFEWKTVGFAGVGCVRYMAFQSLLNIVVIVAECFTSFYDFQYPNVTTLCLFWTVCECSCFELFFFFFLFSCPILFIWHTHHN